MRLASNRLIVYYLEDVDHIVLLLNLDIPITPANPATGLELVDALRALIERELRNPGDDMPAAGNGKIVTREDEERALDEAATPYIIPLMSRTPGQYLGCQHQH